MEEKKEKIKGFIGFDLRNQQLSATVQAVIGPIDPFWSVYEFELDQSQLDLLVKKFEEEFHPLPESDNPKPYHSQYQRRVKKFQQYNDDAYFFWYDKGAAKIREGYKFKDTIALFPEYPDYLHEVHRAIQVHSGLPKKESRPYLFTEKKYFSNKDMKKIREGEHVSLFPFELEVKLDTLVIHANGENLFSYDLE